MSPNATLTPYLFAAFGILAVSAGIAPLLAKNKRLAGIVNFLAAAASGGLIVTAGLKAVGGASAGIEIVRLGPLALPFLIDGFSGLFLIVIGVMAALSALYSIRYMEHYEDYGAGGYYAAFPLFILGMAALVTVDDLSTGFTIAWQIMTLASFFLIRYEHRKKENVKIAVTYLVLMEISWLLVIAGTWFVNGYRFGEDTHAIMAKMGETSPGSLAAFAAFLLVGFGIKAGVWPLGRLWLPGAHSVAPSPVSALLSGVMLKTGVYGLMRTFLFMAPKAEENFDIRAWGIGIAALGTITLFIGTVQSVKQSDAKRLLAFSSIGQIGYIVLASGLVLVLAPSTDAAAQYLAVIVAVGAMYHIVNHAVFKGLLFMTGGSLLYATGTKDLNRLGGLITLMPLTAVLAGIASLSISGMPPTSGFASKWSIISSSLLAGRSDAALLFFGIVALFTSAVTLACYVKFFGMAFTSSGTEWTVKKTVREVPAAMLIPKILLAAICLIQGLFPLLFYGLFGRVFAASKGFIAEDSLSVMAGDGILRLSLSGIRLRYPPSLPPGEIAAALSPLILFAVFLGALILAFLLKRSGGAKDVPAQTWLCGYKEPENINRYVDKSMFAAFKKLFRWTGGEPQDHETLPVDHRGEPSC
jgi:hydrogenase-4 component B